MYKPSVCIIGVYFGQLPNYFKLWLMSASRNESIDFIIVTDQPLFNLPKNVSIIPMDLDTFKELSDKRLGFKTAINHPYKCCDFKPAYGFILADYIQEYDYWAHCDFDMIFGDIRSYISRYSMEQYEKFLDLGHLSFYKNTEENNKRFMMNGSKCGDYKTVFTSEKNYAFDELSGICEIFIQNGVPTFNQRIYADISKIHSRFTLATSNDNYNEQIFLWKKGKVLRFYIKDDGSVGENEYMYIHFKERGSLVFEPQCLYSDSFLITKKGFFTYSDDYIVRELIKKYNRYPGKIVETKEYQKYKAGIMLTRIKRKFGILRQR